MNPGECTLEECPNAWHILLSHDYRASKYSGQIALYEEALKRNGRTLRDRFICYLSLGVVVRFEEFLQKK